jgi:uncharacterized protein (TIGR03083 family)
MASGAVYRDVMSLLSYDRYCAEIVAQAELLTSAVRSADMTIPVPSCPDWNVGQLLRHLGGVHRWAATIVSTRATEPVQAQVPDYAGYAGEDPSVVVPWLAEGAAQLVEALRAAGPGTPLWTPVPGGSTDFYARRFTHETLIHRADATLALGSAFSAVPEVALDAIDEWLELGALPMHFEVHPQTRELLGPGRTVHLHATDTSPQASAEWVIDLTGETIAWRRAHEKAAVAVRGPLTDLLLVVYKRRSVRGGDIQILGDAELLDFWLERVSFG